MAYKKSVSKNLSTMQHIVIINDWSGDNLYRTILEGVILSKYPQFKVSFLENIRKFSVFEAAFILRFSIHQYPENTIFVLGVSSVVSETNGYLYVKMFGKHVFSSNNGFLGLFTDVIDEIEIRKLPYEKTTFPELDIFIPSICHLIENGNLNEYTEKPDNLYKLTPIMPDIQKNQISASVIYIDSFGNIITNLSKNSFEKAVKNRRFVIYPGTKFVKIEKISDSYDKLEEMEVFAVFNSVDLLEIGIKNSSLSEYYNLKFLSNITVEIYDT